MAFTNRHWSLSLKGAQCSTPARRTQPGSCGAHIVPTGRHTCRRRARAASTSPGRGRRACPTPDSLIVSGMRGSRGLVGVPGPVPAAPSVQRALVETHRKTLTLVLSIPSPQRRKWGAGLTGYCSVAILCGMSDLDVMTMFKNEKAAHPVYGGRVPDIRGSDSGAGHWVRLQQNGTLHGIAMVDGQQDSHWVSITLPLLGRLQQAL